MPLLLFAYGTLRRHRRGHLHQLLRRARFAGYGKVQGRLYDLGHYPALVAGRTAHDRVFGEIYLLRYPESDWPRLDAYEECNDNDPHAEYRREQIDVQLAGGASVRAWCYLYNRPLKGQRRIMPGDYRVYQRRRGADAIS